MFVRDLLETKEPVYNNHDRLFKCYIASFVEKHVRGLGFKFVDFLYKSSDACYMYIEIKICHLLPVV